RTLAAPVLTTTLRRARVPGPSAARACPGRPELRHEPYRSDGLGRGPGWVHGNRDDRPVVHVRGVTSLLRAEPQERAGARGATRGSPDRPLGGLLEARSPRVSDARRRGTPALRSRTVFPRGAACPSCPGPHESRGVGDEACSAPP